MLAEVISCRLCSNANASDGEFTVAIFYMNIVLVVFRGLFTLSEHHHKSAHSKGHNVGNRLLSRTQRCVNRTIKGQVLHS